MTSQIYESRTPEIGKILKLLSAHEVRHVIAGSVAAMIHGVELIPGDLDVVPATDRGNLVRVAAVLGEMGARPPGPFGKWTRTSEGEMKWIPRPTTRRDLEQWRPDPGDIGTLDNLYHTRLGNLDIVPLIMGTYESLMRRAIRVPAFGAEPFVAHIDDLLSTLTVPRRQKDIPRVAAMRELQRRGGER